MKFLRKFLNITIISYLVLPFLIFNGGWTKFYIALPIITAVLWCVWKVYKDMLVKYDWPIISKQHISGNVGGKTQLGLTYYIGF